VKNLVSKFEAVVCKLNDFFLTLIIQGQSNLTQMYSSCRCGEFAVFQTTKEDLGGIKLCYIVLLKTCQDHQRPAEFEVDRQAAPVATLGAEVELDGVRPTGRPVGAFQGEAG